MTLYKMIDNLQDETQEDKEQIKRALKFTKYDLFIDDEYFGKVNRKKAIESIGIENFVSGIERSAFHCTAARSKENKTIIFDSYDLFKE